MQPPPGAGRGWPPNYQQQYPPQFPGMYPPPHQQGMPPPPSFIPFLPRGGPDMNTYSAPPPHHPNYPYGQALGPSHYPNSIMAPPPQHYPYSIVSQGLPPPQPQPHQLMYPSTNPALITSSTISEPPRLYTGGSIGPPSGWAARMSAITNVPPNPNANTPLTLYIGKFT